MKRLSPPSRRLFSRLAAAAVGVLVVLSIASPASACEATISAKADCQDAATQSWNVTWTITNTNSSKTATITEITPPVEGIAAQTQIPAKGSVTGTQKVTGAPESKATLSIKIKWGNGSPESTSKSVTLKGTCPSPSPSPKPSASPSPAAPSTAPSTAESVAPTATTSPSASSGLPVTGAPTIAIISVAAVLIVGGGALLLVTRRRRSGAAQ